ncbi:MAG: 6-hydroxycyclohex-1-ene-1-carbonyl-CoA dehydrogenase [Polyangiaceae bacterium]|jgi:6-hydroxycyclohex-1-ene-1-carbonyl-CoA dehydrogenase|nr:6-hydroxycyclohex-1-ene-1-carbonyl-CoA dehydrogenase [Polyangiaceae bacterium]
MGVTLHSWQMTAASSPLARATCDLDPTTLPAGSVLVRVAGCGVCHTDLGFFYDGVPTRHPLPLTLGHEISGTVVHAGEGAGEWVGRHVVVPAVIPCGDCAACKAGRGAICPKQMFPGNDDHGGFASHVVVPSRGLCAVDTAALEARGLRLADLAVIADAVTTPYQAILNAGLRAGDVAIFVGVGGVGLFGVQIARALGANVVALDVDPIKVERAKTVGAAFTRVIGKDDARAIKAEIKAWAKDSRLPAVGHRIFETSGHPAGQTLAFSLLVHGAHLGIVGYTPEPVTVRLSNLMAFDATARGTWGCLPEHYPAVVELVASGKVEIASFIEPRPMSEINQVFAALHAGTLKKRPVLIPDFEADT